MLEVHDFVLIQHFSLYAVDYDDDGVDDGGVYPVDADDDDDDDDYDDDVYAFVLVQKLRSLQMKNI